MGRSLFTAARSIAFSAAMWCIAAAPASARPAYPGYAPGYFSRGSAGSSGAYYGGYSPGYFGTYRPLYNPEYGAYRWSYGYPMPYTDPRATFSAGGGQEVVGDTVIGGTVRPPEAAAPTPTPAPTPTANTVPAPVRVYVHVPASAEVWFDGYQTNRTGEWRTFQSEPVSPARDYFYSVRARWTENGREVDQTRRIKVRPDEEATVDFTRPAPADPENGHGS